uniref:RELT like 1 n=1 Tax=Cyprinodon variegatus TaxID=28743 RepID=A0A3Q2DTC0_CYPVA
MVGSSALMSPTPSGNGGHTQFLAFALVLAFFLLGLAGVVICHVLKRRGYRCTTAQEDDDDDEVFEEGDEFNETMSENNDTVGQIVHYIMKNEANSDALNAMVHQNSIDSDVSPTSPVSLASSTPPPTPISPGAPPGAPKHTCNHLHTIGGLGGHKNICNRCNQKKWPLMRKPSARKSEQRRSNEVTVLSVGRFRVTKCEKPAKDRRTILISESNGSVPSTPTEVARVATPVIFFPLIQIVATLILLSKMFKTFKFCIY